MKNLLDRILKKDNHKNNNEETSDNVVKIEDLDTEVEIDFYSTNAHTNYDDSSYVDKYVFYRR